MELFFIDWMLHIKRKHTHLSYYIHKYLPKFFRILNSTFGIKINAFFIKIVRLRERNTVTFTVSVKI